MPAEIDVYGVYLPTLALIALCCFFASSVLRRFLVRTGFYGFVWHRPLFDAALYFILLGGSVFLLVQVLS